jgi:hypothetical protein
LQEIDDPTDRAVLDDDMLTHVIAATAEDPDEAPEPAEEPAETGSDVARDGPPPFVRSFDDCRKLVSELRSTTSDLTRKLGPKSKKSKCGRLMFARACRAINQQQAKIEVQQDIIDEQQAETERLSAELDFRNNFVKNIPFCQSRPGPGLKQAVAPTQQPNDVRHQLPNEINTLMDQAPPARRYSNQMCDFAYDFLAISPKSFAWASNVFPFPSNTTVLESPKTETISVEKALGEQGQIPSSRYRNDYRVSEGIPPGEMVPVCLAFDATPISSTVIGKFHAQSNFELMLLSLNHRLPDRVIKSVKHVQGHIDQGIRDLREEFLEVLKTNGFCVILLRRMVTTESNKVT